MHTTPLRKVGGSVLLTIPSVLLDLLHLRGGATVFMSAEHGHLIVEPARKPRYTLDDLLAPCEYSAEPSPEERLWLDGGPQGGELL